jgi:poly(hydroxyalkanoate) depolymerase family esterase
MALAMGLALPGVARGQMKTPVNGEFIEGRFESRFGARRYKLFIPATPAPAEGRVLVVMLHGCTQDADDIARGTRLNERAAVVLPGALVLYPEQSAADNPQKCWNWFDHSHQARDGGEPALLAALIADVAARYTADERRVFLGGISAGGAMAVNLAVSYPERFAGVAVHSGIPYRAAGSVMEALPVMRNGPAQAAPIPATKVPLLVLHGEADAVVSARNASALAAQWRSAVEQGLGTELTSREETGRAADGRAFHRVLYTKGKEPALVEWWTVRELGHAWSGGASDGTFTDPRGVDATTVMLDFFTRHDGRPRS